MNPSRAFSPQVMFIYVVSAPEVMFIYATSAPGVREAVCSEMSLTKHTQMWTNKGGGTAVVYVV